MITRMRRLILLISFLLPVSAHAQQLAYAKYQKNIITARSQIEWLIDHTKNLSANDKIDFIIQQLLDVPYLHQGAMGEGDWQANSKIYKPGAIHLQQFPVYRLNGLDCQTLVQNVMAISHAKNLLDFESKLLHIAYGAAQQHTNDIVHFYNRNHFIEADFNRINRQNTYFREFILSDHTQWAHAILERQRWFDYKKKNFDKLIAVFDQKNFLPLKQYYEHVYQPLPFANFKEENVQLSYLPKNSLIMRDEFGIYHANAILLNSIPTPAVVEIVRDPKQWREKGLTIKERMGTDLLVSHMGLLYEKKFKRNDWIYDQIHCQNDVVGKKYCQVSAVYCEREFCHELMFAHTTTAYPNNFYWHDAQCSETKPEHGKVTTCNRVESLPLAAYLMSYQNNQYIYMNDPSILGVHVEVLS